MIKKNIENIKDCYGCGVCAIICPKKIIDLKLNKNGFYVPSIYNKEACIECGLCLDVCSFNKNDISEKYKDIKYYAGWSNDNNIRRACSSGGIGFAIAKKLIRSGYKCCGVKYNPMENRAEHFVADTIDAFTPSIGSKYIPSYSITGFSQINNKDKFLITGTPCQIDSIRRYTKKLNIENNFVLLDFFCHGVPSMLMWNKYLNDVKKITGEISFISWRNKNTGWHDSWAMASNNTEISWIDSYGLKIKEKKANYYSRLSQGDLFYKFFLGNYCLNKPCYYNCKYKMDSSSADIRIGDLWGEKYHGNNEGVSAVIALSEVGKKVLSEINDCSFVQETYEVTTQGQMKKAAKHHFYYEIVNFLLKTPATLRFISYFTMLYELPRRIINKILRILKVK